MWYSSQNGTDKTQGTTTIQGITYHMYPKVPNVRTGWVVALGVEDWIPKIRSTAAPVVAQDAVNVGDYGEPATLKACRICLATDSKLYPIKMQKLKQAYEHLTGISLQAEDRLPQKLCAECAQRVLSGHRFRNRALRANSLMLEIVNKQDRLTLQDINMLSLKNFTVDEIEKPLSPVIQKVQGECSASAITIKHESEILKTDDIIAEQANDIQENELQAVEFLNDDSQDDFDMALDENSLDDSQLSLQKSKAENIEKKTEVTVKTGIERVNKVIDPVEPQVDGRKTKPRIAFDSLINMFTVTDLSFDEQVAKIWKRQDSYNYKNAIYKCTECFKGFLDEDVYKRHLIKHSNHAGVFECEVCKCHFKKPHNLRRHTTAHAQRFSCKECPYVTSNRTMATLHVRYHKGLSYACPHCPRVFHHPTSCMSHLRIAHPSDFVCEICGYSFVSVKGMKQHKKLKHKLDNAQVPEDGPFCELCNVRFVSVEAHKRHLRISLKHSTGTEIRERNDAANVYNIKKYLIMKKKTREGQVSCEQCDLQLKDYRAYYFHFRRMHPDKNRTNFTPMAPHCLCEVCGKMFLSNAVLQEHSYVHTGETPFKCETCGKAFHMKGNLAHHQQIHSTERRTYMCKICGKHFSTLSNRQRHMAIHSGLRPFICDACGKSYKTDAERKSHFNYVHLKKPWPKRVRGNRRRVTKQVSEVEIDPWGHNRNPTAE